MVVSRVLRISSSVIRGRSFGCSCRFIATFSSLYCGGFIFSSLSALYVDHFSPPLFPPATYPASDCSS